MTWSIMILILNLNLNLKNLQKIVIAFRIRLINLVLLYLWDICSKFHSLFLSFLRFRLSDSCRQVVVCILVVGFSLFCSKERFPMSVDLPCCSIPIDHSYCFLQVLVLQTPFFTYLSSNSVLYTSNGLFSKTTFSFKLKAVILYSNHY